MGFKVKLLDAIAEQLSLGDLLDRIKEFEPDYILTLIGFECFDSDINCLNQIKKHHQNSEIIAFGHYPTIFCQEILSKSSVDHILIGEPEENLVRFFEWRLYGKESNAGAISGFVSKEVVTQHNSMGAKRIHDIKELPSPAYDLMNAKHYFEPFMPRPFAMIQSARGCPYKCNYCVKSYGSRLTLRTPQQIIDELKWLVELHQIRSFRFIDDTFTVNHHRVKEICQLLAESKLNLKWSCLSRTDNIKPDLLHSMKKAGCQRIYFGIESGSQRMLDIYEKDIDVNEARSALKLTRQIGIETSGFFMLGLPEETENDFQKTVEFAITSDLSLASVGGITLYPGTPLYERNKNQIDFSLFPYINRFHDIEVEKRYLRWEREFYNKFFFRSAYFKTVATTFLTKPNWFIQTAFESLKYTIRGSSFMPGINRQQMMLEKTTTAVS
ncbi:MAG: radical SAM protein [Chitinophagales bacterium]|nr:radical SAM protein [Chitinophagales bacterium]